MDIETRRGLLTSKRCWEEIEQDRAEAAEAEEENGTAQNLNEIGLERSQIAGERCCPIESKRNCSEV